jgi:DNA-dependent protein kinase catalytic subunit
MNEIFLRTAATCKRRLAIKTYQVVPMTGKVGMIEWLNDTRPLKVRAQRFCFRIIFGTIET